MLFSLCFNHYPSLFVVLVSSLHNVVLTYCVFWRTSRGIDLCMPCLNMTIRNRHNSLAHLVNLLLKNKQYFPMGIHLLTISSNY